MADDQLSEWSVSSAKDPGKAEGKAMGERLMVQTLYKKVRVTREAGLCTVHRGLIMGCR